MSIFYKESKVTNTIKDYLIRFEYYEGSAGSTANYHELKKLFIIFSSVYQSIGEGTTYITEFLYLIYAVYNVIQRDEDDVIMFHFLD